MQRYRVISRSTQVHSNYVGQLIMLMEPSLRYKNHLSYGYWNDLSDMITNLNCRTNTKGHWTSKSLWRMPRHHHRGGYTSKTIRLPQTCVRTALGSIQTFTFPSTNTIWIQNQELANLKSIRPENETNFVFNFERFLYPLLARFDGRVTFDWNFGDWTTASADAICSASLLKAMKSPLKSPLTTARLVH